MPKPQKFKNLVKKLHQHDSRFEFYSRCGKGSERMIYYPDVNGRPVSYAVTCHDENTERGRGMVKAIIRRFNLPHDFFN